MLITHNLTVHTWSLSAAFLIFTLFADFGLMIPDFSTQPAPLKGLPGYRNFVAEQAKQAKDATEKLLQSDDMQSRFQQALQKRDEEQGGAAPQDSSSNAMQALQQAAQHSAREGQPAEGGTASTSHSQHADQHKKEQPADQKAEFRAELLDRLKASLPADQNAFRGQLLMHKYMLAHSLGLPACWIVTKSH